MYDYSFTFSYCRCLGSLKYNRHKLSRILSLITYVALYATEYPCELIGKFVILNLFNPRHYTCKNKSIRIATKLNVTNLYMVVNHYSWLFLGRRRNLEHFKTVINISSCKMTLFISFLMLPVFLKVAVSRFSLSEIPVR